MQQLTGRLLQVRKQRMSPVVSNGEQQRDHNYNQAQAIQAGSEAC